MRSPGSPSMWGSPSDINGYSSPSGIPGSTSTSNIFSSFTNLTLGHSSQTCCWNIYRTTHVVAIATVQHTLQCACALVTRDALSRLHNTWCAIVDEQAHRKHTHTHTHTDKHAHRQACTQTHTQTRMHTHRHAHTQTSMHTHTHTLARTQHRHTTRTHNTHTQTRMHTDKHAHTHLELSWSHLLCLHFLSTVALSCSLGCLWHWLVACYLDEVPIVKVFQGDFKAHHYSTTFGDVSRTLITCCSKLETKSTKETEVGMRNAYSYAVQVTVKVAKIQFKWLVFAQEVTSSLDNRLQFGSFCKQQSRMPPCMVWARVYVPVPIWAFFQLLYTTD